MLQLALNKPNNSTVLINTAISAITGQIKANRVVVRLRLVLGMRISITDYSLSIANIDLENCYTAGTLLEADTSLAEQSEVIANTKALEKKLIANYYNTHTRTTPYN